MENSRNAIVGRKTRGGEVTKFARRSPSPRSAQVSPRIRPRRNAVILSEEDCAIMRAVALEALASQ